MVHLTEQDRSNLRTRITGFCGLDEPILSKGALDQAVTRRVRVLGLSSFENYWQLLQRGADGGEEMNHLVRLLTNKEAYFFRERLQFEVLRDRVLPEVLATGEQPLRIWSAGCASGEEPYSLAIALLEYQARHGAFEAEVIATDIDAYALAAARQGRYGQRAVRRVSSDLLQKYFSFDGQTHRLVPEAAQLVTFKVHNLVGDEHLPGLENLDVVFCRNVTIYFAEWARDRVNALLAASLRRGGYLFVASAEAKAQDFGRLEPVSTGQTLIFQKQKPPATPFTNLFGPDASKYVADPTPQGTEPPLLSVLARLKEDKQRSAPDSQPGAPLARKGRLVRASQEQSAGWPAAGEEGRRPMPPSLEELVAQAQDRVRAWSKGSPAQQPQEEVLAGSRDPGPDLVVLEQARTAFQQQDYDAALSELDRLPAGVAVWTEAYCLRSAVLLQQEQFEEAEAACQTMLAHDPWYADAHFMLGLVFRQQGQIDEAVRSLEQAIHLEPSHRYAHFYQAEIHRGLGQLARARREYQETLDILAQLEPSSELSLVGLDDDALRQACEVNLEKLASGRGV